MYILHVFGCVCMLRGSVVLVQMLSEPMQHVTGSETHSTLSSDEQGSCFFCRMSLSPIDDSDKSSINV